MPSAMPKDTKTKSKILHSSLCKEMSFTVPTSWEQLSQEQLRYVFMVLGLYMSKPDWEYRVQCVALLYFCNIEVVKPTEQGWLCKEKSTRDLFLLDSEVLPSMMEKVAWVIHPESMRVRIERAGGYEAYDFNLRTLPFGKYLECENYFQGYLQSREDWKLAKIAQRLYKVPEGVGKVDFKSEELLGVFLWFNAVKQVLGEFFPHYLKPSSGTGYQASLESQRESTRAQIRLLTKGDVTKQEEVLKKIDTWTALGELDALAIEAEEIKKKYGKQQL